MRELALVAFLSQKMEHPFSFRRVTLKSQDQSECATPVKLLAQHAGGCDADGRGGKHISRKKEKERLGGG